MFLLVVGIAAQAAEIKVMSAGGIREVMQDLGPKFERANGHSLSITFAAPGAIVQRVLGGEINDVVILTKAGIDSLLKDGKAVAGNVTALARSGIGVAVRKGAPKPDISSPEALKRTLLAARSITYSDPASGATSGVHFAKVLDGLGIASEMKPKTVFSLRVWLENWPLTARPRSRCINSKSLFRLWG
jgi:molybdate transport system substrate-binding protein